MTPIGRFGILPSGGHDERQFPNCMGVDLRIVRLCLTADIAYILQRKIQALFGGHDQALDRNQVRCDSAESPSFSSAKADPAFAARQNRTIRESPDIAPPELLVIMNIITSKRGSTQSRTWDTRQGSHGQTNSPLGGVQVVCSGPQPAWYSRPIWLRSGWASPGCPE